MTFVGELEQLQKRLEDWEKKPRFVIRGIDGSRFDGMVYGFGFSKASPENCMSYLYSDEWYAKTILSEIIQKRKDLAGMLEIKQVTNEELHGIYRNSQIV